jgi:putative ABC transport system ATP-binding protein
MYMAPGQGSIALEGVTRRFRIDAERAITALSGVDLEIEQGAAVALSGPSGSGKSTLLHLIGALERPDEGTVTVGGSELGGLSRRELAAHRRRVGFVFQRFNLLPALTVVDNVMAPVLPYRVDFDKEARARELLAAVGLEGRETSLPSRLSGGQQQRVAIARALINRSPTSRPATSTRAPAPGSSTCCCRCAPTTGSRSCSRRTTARSRRAATGSCGCSTGA